MKTPLSAGAFFYTTYFLSGGIFCMIQETRQEQKKVPAQKRGMPAYPGSRGVVSRNL